jgi:membrane peptidoglycan carboxypeptidase
MAAVIDHGTGVNARVSGHTVAGKTGTAEFGTADPPRTHAWFLDFEGKLAFAVLVEDGGASGRVAAPLAARFLGALGPGPAARALGGRRRVRTAPGQEPWCRTRPPPRRRSAPSAASARRDSARSGCRCRPRP